MAGCVAVAWPLRGRCVAVAWPLRGRYVVVTREGGLDGVDDLEVGGAEDLLQVDLDWLGEGGVLAHL